MKRLTAPLASLALLMATGPLWAQDAPRMITATGTGAVFAVPDMARITIGVEQRAVEAPVALNALSSDVAAVLAALSAAGIAEKDMQTSGLQLELERDYSAGSGNGRIIGYLAATQINIAVQDLDMLGEIIAKAVESGAGQIRGLSFDLSDPAPLQETARRAAVADAMARAGLYAEAAGVDLGPLLTLSEAGSRQPGPFMAEARAQMDMSAVPIAAGELSITASVTMTYQIAP